MAFDGLRIITLRAPTESALADIYVDQKPFVHRCASPGPLAHVRVFTHARGHFHYVGSGMRKLHGFDFELTFRLRGEGDPSSAPQWPVALLNHFARHAIKSGRPFGAGHYLRLPGPIDPDGGVRCAALVPDPELGAGWLQIVGIHAEELVMMSEDGYERFLGALHEVAPMFVTMPGRAPLQLT